MKKVGLNKTELKKQKDALATFNRYLPTLNIKKKQLQLEINKVSLEIDDLEKTKEKMIKEIDHWVDLMGGEEDLRKYIHVNKIVLGQQNVAGVELLTIEEIEIVAKDYDFLVTPFWIDRAIEQILKLIKATLKCHILMKQKERLIDELLKTSQRVKLFEKIKIPETQKCIKKIKIHLGDQQISAVCLSRFVQKRLQNYD